ncbi:MAG: hypothetical protein KatS3mg039_0913 [Candidatus Kapaibacterium sp.]|nr:MAG: hypothetical protein KatS3mg039_0913 [Candidatus Kapabacteria bacterium]
MNDRAQQAPVRQLFGLSQFLTVLVLVVALLAAAVLWNRNRPIRTLQVDGWEHVAMRYRDSIERALQGAIERGQLGSLRDAEERVEAFPFVQAAIARKVGSTLQVTVTERLPVALVVITDTAMAWMDRDGQMLPYHPWYERVTVPLVVANSRETARSALPIVLAMEQFPQVDAMCSEVHVDRGGAWLWLTPHQCRVLLGPTADVQSKVRRLAWVLTTNWIYAARSLDIRWNQRIIVSTATTAETES